MPVPQPDKDFSHDVFRLFTIIDQLIREIPQRRIMQVINMAKGAVITLAESLGKKAGFSKIGMSQWHKVSRGLDRFKNGMKH